MSQSRERRPGRPRAGSEDKRERILLEAFDLFARLGYSATSLNDVARAADISKAGLLHHFGSKEELFSTVLERRDAVDWVGMDPDQGDIWSFLDLWVGLVARNAGMPGMVGLYTAMAVGGTNAGHPAHPWLHQHFMRSVQTTVDYFERGKAAGVVAPDAPSHELARAVVALSDGIQLQWLCARADSVPSGDGDPGPTPVHGDEALDMAAQMRLLVDMVQARWAVSKK